jgi:hypothetical protein
MLPVCWGGEYSLCWISHPMLKIYFYSLKCIFFLTLVSTFCTLKCIKN